MGDKADESRIIIEIASGSRKFFERPEKLRMEI